MSSILRMFEMETDDVSAASPDLVLSRFCYSEMGVFGEMMIEGQKLYTVERPWLQNLPSVSCIPSGEYRCVPRRYNRGGYDAIEITDVPARTHILFHRGNTLNDLAGCIAPGTALGFINGVWAVKRSSVAFGILMDAYGGREFGLRIQQYSEVEPLWRV